MLLMSKINVEQRKGFIYKATAPNGKSYIGQVVEFLRDGSKKGIRGRWKQHCASAKRNSNKGSLYLYRAIIKYGEENFNVEELFYGDVNMLDLIETRFIKMYNTLAPNGYNLQTGGTYTKHSEETCKKRSASMKKLLQDPQKRLKWSIARRGKRDKKKRKCKKKCNENLPKYIYYRESHNGKYKGYVVDHPNAFKRFGKSKFTLEEKLTQAKEYLKTLTI